METTENIFRRKHFPALLRLMYEEKTVRQKDIAERLGMSRGAVCLNMNELDALGFVRQRKEGRCRTYELLQKGADYYETSFLCRDAAEPFPTAAREEAERLRDELTGLLSQIDDALDRLNRSMSEAEELAEAVRTLRGERETESSGAIKKSRHFDTILRILYEEKTVLKKDMSAKLGISMGNTFLHLREMVEAGYVAEGRSSISRTYRLTGEGRRYYETHYLNGPPKPVTVEPPRQPAARKPATVLNERNFSNIMQVLFETGDIPLSDLCTRLDRPHGNVYRDMQNLTIEGFVRKETVRHCNYYALSERGREYCEQCFRE